MLQDAPSIALPPPYTLVRTEAPDVLAEAVRLAPEAGAGTLVLREAPGVLAFALVLEPEEALETAQLAFLLGMAALSDALAAHCPPERPLRIVWPDEIRYDKGRLGGGRFAVAPGTAPGDVPDWLVFAAELIAERDLEAPGAYPDSTSLMEEEFDPAEDIVASFASYMMLYFDRWTHEGVEAVTNRYLMRIDPPLLRGVRKIEGAALVEVTPSGNRRLPPLMEALGASGWRGDGGPRL